MFVRPLDNEEASSMADLCMPLQAAPIDRTMAGSALANISGVTPLMSAEEYCRTHECYVSPE